MWQDELDCLLQIIRKTELVETQKWGIPVFTFNHKNVVGLAGFKNHFALWFYNGVFLKDENKLLINASEGKTKALLQMRFKSKQDINEKFILNYLKEAIENEKQGRVWKPVKTDKINIPPLLQENLDSNMPLQKAWEQLNLTQKKDYIESLTSAKKIETQNARLLKIIPMILQGIGLNDKYKKC